jgi:N6-adenosine-specific RNA methylase IME4
MNPFQGLPEKHFGTIYVDPPWRYATYSEKGRERSPDKHYECMPYDELLKLPVSNLAAKNSMLLMWCVDPMLPQAIKLMETWGFKYKTIGFCWAKLNKKSGGFFTGLGYWTRANPELCILGTRGAPKRLSKSVKRLVVSPRREHSRKPDEIYSHIEKLVGGPYLELFGRTERPGWTTWGNETQKFNR